MTMAAIKNFEEIVAWQKARELSFEVWKLTLERPFSRDFSLCDQINRATGSIMDNIAEGFGRGGNKECIQFLFFAKVSADEVSSQLYRALDRDHIRKEVFTKTKNHVAEVSGLIVGLVKYLQESDFKGIKFNN